MHIILLLLTFFIATPSYAEYSPQAYSDKPIITSTQPNIHYFQSSILPQSYGYGMWFSTSDGQRVKVAIARSANGVDWYDSKVLEVSNNLHSHDPSMLYENNMYTLYFGSSNGGTISIWKNTSQTEDGFSPSQAQQILTSQGSWEGSSLSSPYIFKKNDAYYLMYAGNGNGRWQIGLATSPDGQVWTRCQENPILFEGSGPVFVEYGNTPYLFYNSPRGVEYRNAETFLGCQTNWGSPTLMPSGLGNPNPLLVGSNLWMYGDMNNGIGLMSDQPITIKYPIILIPGMFASWNKDAILHNQTSSSYSWIINPVVTEYQPIISSLKQLGYTENNDLFIYAYDWRQPVQTTADQLDTFIEQRFWNTNSYQPVHIIGHSLGGLISHVYGSQTKGKRPTKQIVSVAAPLKGVIQSYKPLAAGEIERDNSLVWVAENIILHLNAGLTQSKRTVMQTSLPVLYDLVPTYPFLFDTDGSVITSYLTNNTLSMYPIDPSLPGLGRVAGINYETKTSYVLSDRTSLDSMLDIYPDGHPTSILSQDGDGLVTDVSANNETFYSAKALHGETIYRQDFIYSILHKLGLNSSSVTIPQGQQTPIFPAILLFLQSPATMKITSPTGTTIESDSYIHLTNSPGGIYNVTITGSSSGSYTLHTWQIGRDNDVWTTFHGEITSGESDSYQLSFDTLTGGKAYIKPNPTSTPTPSPKPICPKHPSVRGLPHWCKSKVFTYICKTLLFQLNAWQKKQAGCMSR